MRSGKSRSPGRDKINFKINIYGKDMESIFCSVSFDTSELAEGSAKIATVVSGP